MSWWRRRGPLHERLAREGGLEEPDESVVEEAVEPDGPAEPPEGPLLPEAKYRLPPWFEVDALLRQWAQEWEVIVAAEAPDVEGSEVEFVVLADGTLIVESEDGDASLDPLARAVEAELRPPYHARGLRHERGWWAVGARPATVCELPGIESDNLELTNYRGERTVSGVPEETDLGALEELAKARGFDDYAIEAERIDGDLWEAQLNPL